MKRYRNRLIATIFTIVAVFSFSSCEDYDYRWKATNLDVEVEVPVNPDNGRFSYPVRIEDTDIADFRPAREDLLDINTLNSWLVISNMSREDNHRVSNLRFSVRGWDLLYDHLSVISPNRDGEYEINNDGYFNFMADAIDIIRRKGYVDIVISGNSNIYDGYPLVFTFQNNLDIYVRE